MKKYGRRLTALVMASFMAVSVLPGTAFGAEEEEIALEEIAQEDGWDDAASLEEADGEMAASGADDVLGALESADPDEETEVVLTEEETVSNAAQAEEVTAPEAVTITSISGTAGKVVLTWEAGTDVSGYYIYKCPAGGKYSFLGGTQKMTTITDTDVKVGCTYYYKVVAFRKDGDTITKGSYSGFKGVRVSLAAPSVTGTSRTSASSAKVSWAAVDGADGYYVYRALPGGSYSFVGGTTGTSYTDKKLEEGKTYYYKVVAFRKYDGTPVKGAFSAGAKVIAQISAPSGLKASADTASANSLSWTAVAGAAGYRVYRTLKGGTYTLIGETATASYTDKAITAGTTYYYKVCAYKTSGISESVSALSSYASAVRTDAPVFTETARTGAATAELAWTGVKGASGYYVYRALPGQAYEQIGKTTDTSYADTTLESGKAYYYKLVAYQTTSSGEVQTAFSSSTKVMTDAAPEITSAVQDGTTAKLAWTSVSGAAGYKIKRGTADTPYVDLDVTQGSECSYEDKTCEASEIYYYKVYAYFTVGDIVCEGPLSAYKKADQVYTVAFDANSSDAAGKMEDMTCTIGTEEELPESGFTCTGFVFDGWNTKEDGSGMAFDDKAAFKNMGLCGETVTLYAQWKLPAPASVTAAKMYYAANKITIAAVDGADKYNVYRADSENGSYVFVGETEETTYTDKTVNAGNTYYYKVTAVKEQGSKMVESDKTETAAMVVTALKPSFSAYVSYSKTSTSSSYCYLAMKNYGSQALTVGGSSSYNLVLVYPTSASGYTKAYWCNTSGTVISGYSFPAASSKYSAGYIRCDSKVTFSSGAKITFFFSYDGCIYVGTIDDSGSGKYKYYSSES